MRGEYCVGAASILSFISLLLLIFLHVGQTNTSHVPRSISMAKVNVSGYGAGLADAFGDPIGGLYTNNASKPLGQGLGIRQEYRFGLYSHCAYVDSANGTCTNNTAGARFQPYDAITSDMFQNYTQFTAAIIINTTFRDSGYLGHQSRGAYYMFLLGAILAALALFTGVAKHSVAFIISTCCAMLGSLFLLIGAALWTVAIKKAGSINDFVVGTGARTAPLGITVSAGSGLYLSWASFALLLCSVVPYMVSCCTYRG